MEQHNPNKSCEQIAEKKIQQFIRLIFHETAKLQVVVHWHSLRVSNWTENSQHLHIQFMEFSIQIYTDTLKQSRGGVGELLVAVSQFFTPSSGRFCKFLAA
jgi:hypothetical protein